MGNCLGSSTKVGNAKNPSNPSKVAITKGGLSSAPSTLSTASTMSILTFPSFDAKGAIQTLPTPKTECEFVPSLSLKAFTFDDLRSATGNFRADNLIGEGGFGYVYKGWIYEQTFAPSKPGSGMVTAIKKLKTEGFQGHKEWLAEVNYLGQLQHPNLVKLIGYCSEGDNRLLVYEFMPKGSLENHIFRRSRHPIPWATRIKVAVGAARGLSFLHNAESQVIYRDFKASNILLDSEFNVKLSDFGLAKDGPTGNKTHVTTQVVGTHGYAAPEYIATGRLSVKADVYSFGVVLLELLTGRHALDSSKVVTEQNLVDWAKPSLTDKHKLYRIVDSKLEGQYPKKGARAVALLASDCINADARLRPSMSDVLAALEKIQDLKSSKLPPDSGQRMSPRNIPKSPMKVHRSPPLKLSGQSPLPSYRKSLHVL